MQTEKTKNNLGYLSQKIDFDTVRTEKQRIATLYGIAAGVVFSLVTWGYDAFLLARAHAVTPFLVFSFGLIGCGVVGGAAGWLTYRITHLLAGFVCWVAAGIAFAWLAGQIPFGFYPHALALLDPAVSQIVHFPANPGVQSSEWIVRIVVVALSGIAGLLENALADATANSSGQLGRFFPGLVWAVLFFLAGLSPENTLTAPLRAPVVNLNATIQYALDHPAEPLNAPSDTSFRTGSLQDIQTDLTQPRRLILQTYDDTFYNTTVVIRFGGSTYAKCSISNGQPITCAPTSLPELIQNPG
ncbi:MAG TPA: hypothetical protein VGJ97_01815 [Anaerolineaceae bacterium]|jgi:hypothetical protein